MGIRGLTNFIQTNSFFEKYQLHDTKLVLDGNSVYRQLFQMYSTKKNGCFGGDYDKYADYIDEFFEMLASCNVIPYVVFVGGLEHRAMKNKLKKISHRLEMVKSINSTLDESSVFSTYLPLCLEDVFVSIVLKRKIKTIRCDFESYTAILSIARNIGCPILSYDSDYFMCSEIRYIPFQSLCESENKPYPYVIQQVKSDVKYIPCQIFNVNKFLESLRLTGDKLPLLAAMLGNTFIATQDFPEFHLWPVRASFQSRITKIVLWIRRRSVETAVEDILNLASHTEKASLKVKLHQAMKSYKCYKSKYLSYLGIGIMDNLNLPENCVDIENDKLVQILPEVFLENYRKGRYSASLMDIFIHNWYGNLKPQIENMNLTHSHIFSENIIGSIQKILTNSHTELLCVVNEGGHMIQKGIPLCKIEVPSFLTIQEMDIEDRKLVLFKILGLDFLKEEILREFPESYQLFIVIVLYLQKHSSLTWPLCYSLVLCKMILQEVDDKKGHLISCFEKHFNAAQKRQSDEFEETTQMLLEMENFIEYFKMRDDMTRNADLFDINLVHGMSQFQSCLLHIKILNDLLNVPLPDFLISDCFNGTFIYNFSKLLEEKSDMDNFIRKSLFQKSPKLIGNFQSIITKIRKIFENV